MIVAGRGPAPKPPGRKVGHTKDIHGVRTVEFVPAGAKPLPADLLLEGEMWHPATLRWWNFWMTSPLVESWTDVDWSELEACAVLHQEFMKKRTFTLASEIRLRMAKFGATPEDRARLRIVFADADEKDAKRPAAAPKSRDRRATLHALPDVTSDAASGE